MKRRISIPPDLLATTIAEVKELPCFIWYDEQIAANKRPDGKIPRATVALLNSGFIARLDEDLDELAQRLALRLSAVLPAGVGDKARLLAVLRSALANVIHSLLEARGQP